MNEVSGVSSVVWATCAGIIAWASIGIYLFFLSRKQNEVSRRIRQMEATMETNMGENE